MRLDRWEETVDKFRNHAHNHGWETFPRSNDGIWTSAWIQPFPGLNEKHSISGCILSGEQTPRWFYSIRGETVFNQDNMNPEEVAWTIALLGD